MEFPGDHDKPFHTGRDNQQPESLHGISADTSVVTEVMAEQSNVHDTVKLENIAANDRLMAAWDLYKVNQNGGPDTDEYVTTVDAEGQPLTMGQETATSPDVNILDHYDGDWKKAVGEYYWVLRIWDKAPTTEDDRLDLYGEPGDNGGNGGSWAADEPTVTPDGVSHPGTEYRIVHTGKARDPEETFRVIHAETKAVSEEKMGVAIRDKAIVYGPVAKGTKLSWALYENDFASPGDRQATGGVRRLRDGHRRAGGNRPQGRQGGNPRPRVQDGAHRHLQLGAQPEAARPRRRAGR